LRISSLWAAVAILVAISVELSATDPSLDPKFRADDGSLWHLGDNPASWGVESPWAAGYSWAPDATDPAGAQDVLLFSPLVNFRLDRFAGSTRMDVGTSLSFGAPLAVGYKTSRYSATTLLSMTTDFGVLWRPVDLFSLGITANDTFGTAPTLGLGLALRPLALIPARAGEGLSSLLTLTGDARTNSSFAVVPESLGVRLALPWLDIRGWYDWEKKTPGLELTLNLGPTQSWASLPAASAPLEFRAGAALFSGRQNLTADWPWVPHILRLRDVPSLASAPSLPGFWASLLGGFSRPTVSDLLEVLDHASRDPSVVALALENPPSLNGLADAQAVAAGLDALQKAGKKVYVYADGYGANAAFQAVWSHADRISLNPNGALEVHPLETERLYYKDLLDKLGIQFTNLAPWDTKSYSNDLSFSSMPPGERAMNLRLLGDLQDQLTRELSLSRGSKLRTSATGAVNGGPYLLASRAKDMGLIDAVEYRSEFEQALQKAHPAASFIDDLRWSVDVPWGPSPLAKTVAVVTLQGDIITGPGVPGVSIGSDTAAQVAKLRGDVTVSALLLKVDSPGGVVITSDEIAEQVRLTVAAGKPVVAVMENTGASGGYYVSAYASRIFARPGTITGSIGVTALAPSISSALNKLGIHPDSAALSPQAGFADPLRELRPDDLKALNEEISATYERFLGVVATGRQMSLQQVKLVGEGQVWTGREALDRGLVDDLGGLEAAKSWLEQRLGTPLAFRSVYPGIVNVMAGLEQLVPVSGVVRQISQLAGPVLEELSRLTEMGVTAGKPAVLVWAPPLNFQ